MVYQTVYQLTKRTIPFFPQIAFFLVGSLLLTASIFQWRKFVRKWRSLSAVKRERLKKGADLTGMIVFILASFLFIIISISSAVSSWQDESILLREIAAQNIKVASGKVEDFSTPTGGHAPEKFTVEGVPFNYYNDALVSYSTTKENGGGYHRERTAS